MSLNDLWILLTKIKLKVNQCVAPALHVSYGWLAYVLFHAYHLDALEQKSLGKHASLSSWCLRYGLNDLIFALYYSSAWKHYLKFWKTLCKAPLWYAKVLPKSYDDLSWKPYTHMLFVLHWALSNCCDPWENSFHTFMIKIHVHTIYPLAMLLLEVSIVPSTHSTK